MAMTRKPQNLQSEKTPEYVGKESLVDGDSNLPRYNRSIVLQFAKFFGTELKELEIGDRKRKVIDFGAGTGTLAEIFREKYMLEPVCIEVDPTLKKLLTSKKFEVHDSLEKIGFKYSYIYSSNVLEHIENDLDALIEIRSFMASNGKLAIYVPAIPFLFSELDQKAGHYRRYSRKDLTAKVSAAGFKIEKCFYSDSLGILATLVLKIFGYRNRFKLGDGTSLIIYDKLLYPISQFLDRIGFRKLCGKNLLLFAVNQ